MKHEEYSMCTMSQAINTYSLIREYYNIEKETKIYYQYNIEKCMMMGYRLLFKSKSHDQKLLDFFLCMCVCVLLLSFYFKQII